MKKYFFSAIIFICSMFNFYGIRNFGYSTLLLMVEESENGSFEQQKETPIFDGLIDYLWETDVLFFDMQIDKPITVRDGALDPVPFIGEAKYSGADMVLLIKIDYQFTDENGTVEFKLDEIPYTYYSLTNYKVVKNGTAKPKLLKHFNSRKKREMLKEIGKSIGSMIE